MTGRLGYFWCLCKSKVVCTPALFGTVEPNPGTMSRQVRFIWAGLNVGPREAKRLDSGPLESRSLDPLASEL